ncbi:hypothetical protein JCM3765_006769 [Sporobolomyces pararoseus]
MKALSVLLALSYSSIVIASSSHQLNSHSNGHGMRLVKRQAVGGAGAGAGAGSATTSQGSGAASQPSDVASTPSNNNNNNNSPLDSLTEALQSSSSSSPATSASTTDPSTSQEQPSTSNEPETQTSQTPSSSSSVAPVSHSSSSSASSVAPSSLPASSAATTNAKSTVISIVTPSSSASSTGTDESSTSSSPTALSDKKSSSSSGGIGHGTLIAIIVVASCVAGVAAIWTIIRKTAFSPSKRFESKLEPIDFVPEVPDYSPGDHRHHDRSQSQLSGAYGMQRGGGGGDGGYEASLARSDSKGSLRGQGMAMSESGGGLASIPYQGPGGYVQPAYYGETANSYHGSPQLGYPHEQPTYYPALQRGLSSSSSLQHQAAGLGRMNTMGGGAQAYDYSAHARSAGGHHQYY